MVELVVDSPLSTKGWHYKWLRLIPKGDNPFKSPFGRNCRFKKRANSPLHHEVTSLTIVPLSRVNNRNRGKKMITWSLSSRTR
jgi:hypothetical protein